MAHASIFSKGALPNSFQKGIFRDLTINDLEGEAVAVDTLWENRRVVLVLQLPCVYRPCQLTLYAQGDMFMHNA